MTEGIFESSILKDVSDFGFSRLVTEECKELEQKFSSDLEISKYLKRKENVYLKQIRSQNTGINMKNV